MRLAGEAQAFLAGNFRDRAFGGEVAVEDDEVAVLLDRLVERTNDRLAVRIRFHVGERLAPWSGR